MTRLLPPGIPLATLLVIAGCSSGGHTTASGAGGASTSSTSASSGAGASASSASASSGAGGGQAACGDGLVGPGETCDTAISAGQPGACPTSCDDSDPCTIDGLSGAGCAATCAHYPAPALNGDGCCPKGQGTDTDSDCKPLYPVGAPKTVCSGSFHLPTIAAGDGEFAVGCVPNASQNETPLVKILDGQGNEIASHALLTIDGNYYNEIQVSHHDGRFQALYQYNCSDTGSWNVGWGWGCVDFREYDKAGTEVTPSLVFGQPGHNGHPVLDWSGSAFGVSWVSYDNIYFRGIDQSRMLVGAGKGNNLFLGHDPLSSDDRNGARTHLAWDGNGYGVFSIIGGHMYFVQLNAAGQVTIPIKLVTTAFSQHFSGQFAVRYKDGSFAVVSPEQSAMAVNFIKVAINGDLLFTTPIVSGFDIRSADMFEKDGLFYVLTNDAAKNALITVVYEGGGIAASKSGVIGSGPMPFPVAAYDPMTGDIGVAYLSPGWGGSVMFQKFTGGP